MTTHKKSRYIKAAALLAVISTLAYAVFNFNPSTQPLVTLAPYGLKSADLATPNNRAYRPWLENGAYQGDVIEYNLDTAGNRTSTAETEGIVGLNPISDTEKNQLLTYGQASLGTDYTATDPNPHNWTARASFYAQETTDPDYWQKRNIFTYNNGKVDFTWSGTSLDTTQKQALDPVAYNNNATESVILNYIRGDHTNEKNQPNGTLRSRFSLLGDIVNSGPVYIGQPMENYVDEGFQAYKQDLIDDPRDGLVAVGANDGMLHVFSAKDGSEEYAYIPSMLISKLQKLAVPPPYEHTYFVDGRLTVASAKIDDGTGGTKWGTPLIGGLGAGGKGLFALDMTDKDPANHRILFEKDENSTPPFGYIYGKPTIYGMNDGNWYAIIGNGYGAGRAKLLFINLTSGTYGVTPIYTLESDPNTGLSEPTLIDINDDQVGDYAYAGDTRGNMWKFDIRTFPNNVTVTKIFDSATESSTDQPITTAPEIGDSPYGGHMVYFATGNASSLTDATNTKYPAQFVYGIWDQATGSTIVEQELKQTTYTFNSTSNVEETVRYVDTNPLLTGNYEYICPTGDTTCTAIKGWKVFLGDNVRFISGAPQLRAGRVTFVANNPTGTRTYVDKNKTLLTPDLEGDSWLMSLDYLTGGDGVGTDREGKYFGVAFNLNGDDVLDLNDAIKFSDSTYKAPVGLDLGEGDISQPAIARRGPYIDIMYINGLKLPWPQVQPGGPFFNGHIDVVTDSPNPDSSTGTSNKGGSKAPNNLSYMSDGYNVQESDGYGKAVDGLVHAYSDIHDVTYVDLFELEPRRGMTSKSGTPFPPKDPDPNDPDPNDRCKLNSNWTVSTDPKDVDADVLAIHKCRTDETPPNCSGEIASCVVKHLDAELNRAYAASTISTVDPTTDSNGVSSCPPSDSGRFGTFYTPVYDIDNTLVNCTKTVIDPQSEVYLLGGTTPIPNDKPFFVTLANADLSTAGILQIGCRTWKVQDYEDMITSQLEDTLNPKTPAQLEDTIHSKGPGSLMFTLAGIADGTQDYGITCPKDSPQPTLRISFEPRSILDLGIVGTRSQCVLGLHRPEDKVCYADSAVLAAAEDIVPKIGDGTNGTYMPGADATCGAGTVPDPWTVPDPPVDGKTYLQSPTGNWHITWNPNYAGFPQLTGFRWRNGALTLQLVDADPAHYVLQDQGLLEDANGNRKGGTFAKAFELAKDEAGNIIPGAFENWTDPNGMLYEAAIYWHYGRLADDIRTSDNDLGTGNPASTPCFGGNDYYSRLKIESQGANPGEVNRITKNISSTELSNYFNALQNVQNCTGETACAQALAALAQMLADNPDLALYDSILPYINPEDLPDEAKNTTDSAPNRDVESLDITQGIKPQNIKDQRRSWIDLRP